MKKLVFLPVAAIVALSACDADSPTAFATEDANLKNGVASQVGVVATGTVSVGAGVAYLGDVVYPGGSTTVGGVPAIGNGTCWLFSSGDYAGQGGLWRNNGGNFPSPNAPHDNCTVAGTGAEYTITFQAAANHVRPNSGNEHLNFEDLVIYDETDPDNPVIIATEKRYIHYQRNHDRTRGSGFLFGTDDAGGVWTVDLAQIDSTGNTIGSGMTLQAFNDDHGSHPVTLTW